MPLPESLASQPPPFKMREIYRHPAVILFLLSLLASLYFLDWPHAPFLFGDTDSYLAFADSLRSGAIPDISIRTPVYPIFILIFREIFHGAVGATFAQAFFGALSASLLYLFIFNLTRSKLTAFLCGLALILNYGVLQYQAVLLTETLALFLLLLFLVLAQRLFLPFPSLALFSATALSGSLLILERPNFLALPLLIFATIIAYTLLTTRQWRDRRVVLGWQGVGITVAVILVWSGLVYRQTGYFGFSGVAEINRFGKVLQYGYFDEEYPDPPPYYHVLKANYDGYRASPDKVLRRLEAAGQPFQVDKAKPVNDYILARHKTDTLKQGFQLVIRHATVTEPEIYAPARLAARPLATQLTSFFTQLIHLSWLSFPLCLLITCYLAIKRKKEEAILWAVLLLTIAYQMGVISYLSYTDYPRLRMPADSFLISLVILPVGFVFQMIFGFLSPLKKPLRPLLPEEPRKKEA